MTVLTELNFNFISIVLSILLFAFFLIFSLVYIKKGNKEKSLYLFVIISITQLLILTVSAFDLKSMNDCLPGLMSLMCLPLFVYIKAPDKFRRIIPLALSYLVSAVGLAISFVLVPERGFMPVMKILPLVMMGVLAVANWTLFFITSTDKTQIIRDGQPRTHLYSELLSNYTILLLFFLALLALAYFNMGASWSRILLWTSFMGILLICILLLYSHLTGKVMLFGKKWDDSVQTALKVCVAESKASVKADQTYRAIYERLIAYFEVEKPFLDADLTLMQVAQKIYCNKLYLSKTICVYTGRNFCQFVNYHRIKHALKVYEEEPDIRISSWATMCGFRTVASFSMAFKLFVNESPGEWLKKTREMSGKF